MSEEININNEDQNNNWYDYEDPNEINFIGTKFIKPDYDSNAYTAIAEWCNATQKAYIAESEDGTYYECIAIPEKSLDDLKQEKLNELESRFTERVRGSFITDEGYKMQFNESDCNKLNGAIVLMENLNNTTGYLTDADDNTHFDISIDVMKSVLIQMLKKYAQCHLLKQQYRAVINEAESIEDLTKINIVFE